MRPSLDLHGVRHEEVDALVLHFINDHWDLDDEIEIITGLSERMIGLVSEVLEDHKLSYRIGDHWGRDAGKIIVEM